MTVRMDSKQPKTKADAYDVEEILEEARRIKKARLEQEKRGAFSASEQETAPAVRQQPVQQRQGTGKSAAVSGNAEKAVPARLDKAAEKLGVLKTIPKKEVIPPETPIQKADKPLPATTPKPTPLPPLKPAPKPVPLPVEPEAPRPVPVQPAQEEKEKSGKKEAEKAVLPIMAPASSLEGKKEAARVESAAQSVSSGKETPSVDPSPVSTGAEEEDVKVFVPRSAAKRDGKSPHEKASPSELAKTIILHTFKGEDDLDQIQMESLLGETERPDGPVEMETAEEKPAAPEDWEERLQEQRRKKAENFKIQPPFKLSGEEEENDPAEEPEVFEDDELEDYNSYEETEAVRNELVYRRRVGWLQLVLTGVTAAVLLAVSVVMSLFELPLFNATLLVSLNLFLLGVAALMNHRAVGGGLAALFRMKADADSAVGAATAVVLIHTAVQFLNLGNVAAGKAVILAPVAALGLFLSALGRQMLILRVSRNFQFVSYRGEKYAARIVEDSRAAVEIGRAAVALGEPVVCYLEKTGFLTHFLQNSYDGDAADRAMRLYMPISLAASLAIAVVYGVFSQSAGAWLNALTVFASAVCLSAPLAAVSATNFPMLRAARRALRRGAMLVGWRAAEEFGGTHALAVDALDLFPSESVLLHGIKTFSGTRIDEAILDAAAVSIAAGGPLSSVFRRVIQDRTDILQDVDTLVYEQDMGMSGWVGGRRVLIGNRRLLENHGVDVPSRDYEARYTKDHRQLVYLSTAGELSAMFVVSYLADEGIADALEALESAGITLLVRTCDPNVTEEMVCRVFDLDPYYVEIMGAPAGRRYEQLTAGEKEENETVMASNGRLEGIAYALTYCHRLWGASRLAVALQIIGGAVGLALSMVLSLYTGYLLPALFLAAYILLWLVISWVLPCIRRV